MVFPEKVKGEILLLVQLISSYERPMPMHKSQKISIYGRKMLRWKNKIGLHSQLTMILGQSLLNH